MLPHCRGGSFNPISNIFNPILLSIESDSMLESRNRPTTFISPMFFMLLIQPNYVKDRNYRSFLNSRFVSIPNSSFVCGIDFNADDLKHGGSVKVHVWVSTHKVFCLGLIKSMSSVGDTVVDVKETIRTDLMSSWEADKMLDVYIHDYLLKRKLHASAKAFMTEGKVATDPLAIDAPGGFLFEWWSVFWDIFISRTNEKHSEAAVAYIETQQMKAKEHQQQLQMQQMHFIQQRNAQMQRRDPNHPPLNDGMMGKPSPSSLSGMKMYEEPMKPSHSLDLETSPNLLDATRMALLKSPTNPQGHLVQGNSPNMSTSLHQMQGRPQLNTEIKQEVEYGTSRNGNYSRIVPSSLDGFAVFMVHLATIPITGTGINPARSFGAAVIYNNEKVWDDQWIFCVGPFVGALAAAAYHQYILRAAAIKALGSFRSNPTN